MSVSGTTQAIAEHAEGPVVLGAESITAVVAEGAYQRPRAVAASIVVGSAALMVLGIQPILLGGLIHAGRITEAGLGAVAMAEVLGLAVGSCIGPALMNRGAMRWAAAVVSIALALANLATCWASDLVSLVVVRGVAGLTEGLALGAAVVVMTYTRQPARVSGLFLGVQTAPQMLAALALPTVLIPRFGVNGGFVLLALLALAGAAGAFGMVDRVAVARPHGRARVRWTLPLILSILAIVIQGAGIGAAWNYSERLAAQHGLSPAVVASAISASLVCQIVGALLVAWVGWRAPHRAMLIAGSVAQAAVVLVMVRAATPAAFIAATSLFGFFWLALQPYVVNQAIAVDETRIVAVLLTPIGLAGFSLGPLIVSTAVTHADVTGAFGGAAALLGVAAIGYGLAGSRSSGG